MLLRPAGHLLDEYEQHRNQADAQDRRDEHAREDGHPHHLAPLGAGAGRGQQRHDTEDEREGRHQDRAEAQLRRDIVASMSGFPDSSSIFANSTIRIAFFAARPMSMISPICAKTLFT